MTQAMAVSTGEKMPTLFCPNRPSFYIGVFAEFETNLRRELQMEGIAAAKLKGVYKGRPPSIDAARVAALKAEGLGATETAKRLGVGRASVYRLLGA
jgi:DNA invertase Pin-like site-specific DNA recombinase